MVKMLLGNVYSNSGEGREEFLLRPYDGEQPLIRRRVGTGDDHIDRPCIGMLLMLQTDFLKKIGTSVSFFDSGLASRCLFCYPESWVGKRDENGNLLRADDDYEIPLAVEEKYNALICDLLDRAYDSDDAFYYTLDKAALNVWRDFYHEVEAESSPGGKYANMQDFAIRYPTLVLRLALLLAVVESNKNISIKNMDNAVKLMHYFMASAKRCNDAMRQTNIPDNARKIISYWHRHLSNRPRPVSIRELENSIELLKSEVEDALQVLIERNYCRYLPQESNEGKKGRKPSPKLEINPQFFE